MSRIKILRVTLIGFMLCLLSACSTIPMSEQDRQNLHSLKVQVTNNSDGVYVNTKSMQIESVANRGLLGFMVAGAMASPYINRIKTIETNNRIDISKILFDTYADQLQKSTHIKIYPESDTVLSLNILQYGLNYTKNSHQFIASILVQAKITRGKRTIWEASDQVDGALKAGSYTITQMEQNPQLLKDLYTQAAEKVSTDLINMMMNNKSS